MSGGIEEKLRSTENALNNLHDDTILISQPLVVSKQLYTSVLFNVVRSFVKYLLIAFYSCFRQGELAEKSQLLMTKNMNVLV